MASARKLAIILGAGASHDCVPTSRSSQAAYRPPLTQHVFDDRYRPILQKYARVEALAGTIDREIQKGRALEAVLRDLTERNDRPCVMQVQQVPLYLQELFGEVGQHYTTMPHNLCSLVHAVLQHFEQVAFITTNYDVLLEKALDASADYPARKRQTLGLDWYVRGSSQWMVIKLHGSVDWGRAVLQDGQRIRVQPESLSETLEKLDSITVRECEQDPIEVLPKHQAWGLGGCLYVPALAIPVEGKYAAICPEDHLTAVRGFLGDCSAFLSIGNAAKDGDLLELVFAQATNSAVVGVVCGNDSEALDAYRTLRGAKHAANDIVSGGGFSDFIASGKLDDFVKSSR